jgi:hypothetical protein
LATSRAMTIASKIVIASRAVAKKPPIIVCSLREQSTSASVPDVSHFGWTLLVFDRYLKEEKLYLFISILSTMWPCLCDFSNKYYAHSADLTKTQINPF